jgi:hypothetical protein
VHGAWPKQHPWFIQEVDNETHVRQPVSNGLDHLLILSGGIRRDAAAMVAHVHLSAFDGEGRSVPELHTA